MKNIRLLPVIVLALGLAACSSTGAAHRHDGSAVYLDRSRLEELAFPPAPAAGSQVDQADMAAMHDWQAKRTPAQCAEALAEGDAYFDEFFGGLKPFSAPLPKESLDFLVRVREDISTAVSIFKDRNARQRPYVRDASLSPCLGRVPGLSYPSGHATISRVYALMLSELAPQRRAAFMARGDEAALYRVIGGVHHPSDIEAGKQLGDTLFARFMENPAFLAGMNKLRPFAAK